MSTKAVTVYTDGACIGNPGPGGYGAVLLYDQHRRELSGGFRLTTNNRMELTAVIVALSALKTPSVVRVFSDSQYVVEAMDKGWAAKWQANDWHRNRKDRAVNPDLWGQLLAIVGRHEVSFEWIKGHAGHAENERCDQLAVAAANGDDLPDDPGYGAPTAQRLL